ncbi:serine/threonine-protein kinase [Nocardia inohanensis]|uniref:serine/threonine-protein kinase n=1 Tax=Nocardia inohanensis TaxID=209246 RepID=UPI000A04F2F3
MLNSGDVFAGFRIERLLGQGGMGSVYLARHPRLGKLTALKLLNRELFADREIRTRFEREADLVAQLDHPNIVEVYDRGTEDAQLWISMQYVDGVDAAGVDVTQLPPERAVQIIEGVASALDYAHSRGVLHRDVKPANIILARAVAGHGERVFLTDFGIARLREDSTHLTQAGMFTATLAYASPEQMTGQHLDHTTDQYSLGCALYWLLIGIGPFDSPHPAELIRGHLQLLPPPVSLRRPGLSPAMDAVITKAMAKRPIDRFPSCTDFAKAARRALSAPLRQIPTPPVQSGPTHRPYPQNPAAPQPAPPGYQPPSPYQPVPPGYQAPPAAPQQPYPAPPAPQGYPAGAAPAPQGYPGAPSPVPAGQQPGQQAPPPQAQGYPESGGAGAPPGYPVPATPPGYPAPTYSPPPQGYPAAPSNQPPGQAAPDFASSPPLNQPLGHGAPEFAGSPPLNQLPGHGAPEFAGSAPLNQPPGQAVPDYAGSSASGPPAAPSAAQEAVSDELSRQRTDLLPQPVTPVPQQQVSAAEALAAAAGVTPAGAQSERTTMTHTVAAPPGLGSAEPGAAAESATPHGDPMVSPGDRSAAAGGSATAGGRSERTRNTGGTEPDSAAPESPGSDSESSAADSSASSGSAFDALARTAAEPGRHRASSGESFVGERVSGMVRHPESGAFIPEGERAKRDSRGRSKPGTPPVSPLRPVQNDPAATTLPEARTVDPAGASGGEASRSAVSAGSGGADSPSRGAAESAGPVSTEAADSIAVEEHSSSSAKTAADASTDRSGEEAGRNLATAPGDEVADPSDAGAQPEPRRNDSSGALDADPESHGKDPSGAPDFIGPGADGELPESAAISPAPAAAEAAGSVAGQGDAQGMTVSQQVRLPAEAVFPQYPAPPGAFGPNTGQFPPVSMPPPRPERLERSQVAALVVLGVALIALVVLLAVVVLVVG